jgi:hypothetical protein
MLPCCYDKWQRQILALVGLRSFRTAALLLVGLLAYEQRMKKKATAKRLNT